MTVSETRRRWSAWTALSVALACGAGCGGGTDSAPAAPLAATTDLDIARAVYATESRTPPGFYSEPVRYPGMTELRFHVSNDDLGNPGVDGVRFEVCSDDFTTALDWVQIASLARGLPGTVSGTDETEWFYRIERQTSGATDTVVSARVFKCSALERSSRDAAGAAGRIVRSPRTAADLAFVSEYLWQYSVYNNALHAVVESVGEADANVLHHDLIHARAVRGAAGNGCDRIEVWQWRHSVVPDTGALTEVESLLRTFPARSDAGSVSLCAD